jgi:hypothetical protein
MENMSKGSGFNKEHLKMGLVVLAFTMIALAVHQTMVAPRLAKSVKQS